MSNARQQKVYEVIYPIVMLAKTNSPDVDYNAIINILVDEVEKAYITGYAAGNARKHTSKVIDTTTYDALKKDILKELIAELTK